MRARTLSSGKLRIRCTKDAPEQNAYKWHTLKTERHKRIPLLYSLGCGVTTAGLWLSLTMPHGTHAYCAAPASPAGTRAGAAQ